MARAGLGTRMGLAISSLVVLAPRAKKLTSINRSLSLQRPTHGSLSHGEERMNPVPFTHVTKSAQILLQSADILVGNLECKQRLQRAGHVKRSKVRLISWKGAACCSIGGSGQ